MSCHTLQVRGANVLGLPVIVTEQYPKALGSTVQELKDVLPPNSPVIAKTLFSMLTPEVSQLLREKPTISQASAVLTGVTGRRDESANSALQ